MRCRTSSGWIATATVVAALPLCAPALAFAQAAGPEPVPAPLPSSALMGMFLLMGIAAFLRFPTGKRQYRRHRAAA